MGLLNDIEQWVDQRKRAYGNAARGLLNTPQDTIDMWKAQDAEAARGNRYTQMSAGSVMPEVAQQGQEAMLNAAMNVGGLLGITAYHGSPHTFDKFDMSKIGTGEGAQAYGHGLYFAESPATAKSYQHGLSDWYPNGVKPQPGSAEDRAAAYVAEAIDAQHGHPLPAAIQKIKRLEDNPEAQDAMLKAIGKWSQEGAQWKRGNLYKVDIPDDAVAKMLDWDKPLSQQPEAVRKALKPLLEKVQKLPDSALARGERAYLDNPSSLKGSDVYNMYRRYFGGDNVNGADASELLRQAGVPGIRYLDAGSRGKGGTSNFVLFDDNLPKILSRE